MDKSELIYNVERAGNQDHQAIEALYNYTYPRMYALVCRLCSDQNDAEDILQESYTTAFLKLDTLKEKAAFYNWPKKIVINQWRNYSREKSYLETTTLYDATKDITDSQLTEPSSYDVVAYSETTDELWTLVNQLPENQRICVILHYYEEMKLEDIAEVLQIPLGSVKSRLYYSRNHLKKKLEQRGLNAGNVLSAHAAKGIAAANSELLSKVLAALEAASKSSAATVAAEATCGGLMMRLGIGLVSLLTAGGIIGGIAMHPEKPQPEPPAAATTVQSTPTQSTAIQTVASTTTAATTATTVAETTVATVPSTKSTDAPQPFTAFTYNAANGGVTITGCSGNESRIVIPDSIDGLPVIGIAPNAFAYSDLLTSVSIPGSVTRIGVGAFRECNSLSSVSLHAGLRSIGETAFLGCDSLVKVEIPAGVESIGAYAFAYCGSLQEVTIGEGLTVIRYGTFYQCPSLQYVSLPDSIQDIGENAFD